MAASNAAADPAIYNHQINTFAMLCEVLLAWFACIR